MDVRVQTPTGSVVALVVATVLLVLYAVLCLRQAVKIQWLAVARKLLAKARAILRSSPQSDLEKAAQSKAKETRVLRARTFVSYASHITAVWTCNRVRDDFAQDRLSLAQDGVHLVSFGILLLLHHCPQLLNTKTQRLWQSALLAFGGCALVAPGICPPHLLALTSHKSWVWITVVGFTFLDSAVAVLWVGIFLAAVSSQLYLSPLGQEDVNDFWTNLGTAACLCGWMLIMERWVEGQHRVHLEAVLLEEKQSASNQLLKIFYDVVLELDSDFTITTSAPELAVFLPNHVGCPCPQLQHTKFEDLLTSEEDRQLFVERMQRPPAEDSRPVVEVMHLRMRQGNNDSINAELFGFGFQGLMGQWRHLLGIREFNNEVMTSPGCSEPRTGDGELAAMVNAFHPGKRVLEMTQALQRELGRVVPGCNIDQVVHIDPQFTQWFQKSVNFHLFSDERLQSNSSCQVQLRSRWGGIVQVQADCHIVFEQSAEDDVDDTFLPVRLVFSNLQRTQRRRGSAVSSMRRSGSSIGTPREVCSQPLGRTVHSL